MLQGVPSFIQKKVNIIQGVPVNKSQDGSQAADGAGNDWAGTLLHVWSQHVSWGQGTGQGRFREDRETNQVVSF